MSIYKVNSYTDDENRTVIERVSIDDTAPTLYIGSVMIKTNKGVFPVEFEIKNDTNNLEKCFAEFDETLKTFIEEKQKEAQTKIITPEEAGVSGNLLQFPKG